MLEHDHVIDVSFEPKTIPPIQGWYWIMKAFNLFKQAPTVWISICGVFVILFFGIAFLPMVGGFISTLLGPVFLGGIMWSAKKHAAGEVPKLTDLFFGFKYRFFELLKIGMLYMLGTILVMVLMTVLLTIASFFGWLSFDKNIQLIEQVGSIWPVLIGYAENLIDSASLYEYSQI
ncbi:hypothetical protein, partial [uncultured Deefgea sp.]|uniref:hypothetical protein n=1 Tax=uncultured Deefgea sp. TaxID=1304914 RepID=UPI00261B393C